MNEIPEPNLPQNAEASAAATPPVIDHHQIDSKPFSYWLKRFLACNPFYLVSAALLLYGVYRVSGDANFLKKETAQLTFNFASLQFYEVLLVLTAIILARRRIWYDSTLLVALENMLVLVPFILISQAALIDSKIVWVMCVAGGVIAVVRFGGLKIFLKELELSSRLLSCGLALLLVNIALPLIYRVINDSKAGKLVTEGPAFDLNEYSWLLLLPAICALANLLPRSEPKGELMLQRRWLPPGLFLLWVVVTGVHLYSLGYVYDFGLRQELLAPAIWVLMWTARHRAADWLKQPAALRETLLLLPPALATLLATTPAGSKSFLILTALNVVMYGGIYFLNRQNRFALHLLFLSVAALIAGLPENWGQALFGEFSRPRCVAASGAGYLLLWAALSRNPKLGMLGALGALAGAGIALGDRQNTFHWAVQSGLVFLLLHSLRWEDEQHHGAGALRAFVGLGWIVHSFVWLANGGAPLSVYSIAAFVLSVYFTSRLFAGVWGSHLIPAAALLVLLCHPGNFAVGQVRATPVSLLIIIASFLLFGLGTLAALTKHHWNRND